MTTPVDDLSDEDLRMMRWWAERNAEMGGMGFDIAPRKVLALLDRLAAADSQREALRAALERLTEAQGFTHVSVRGGPPWHSTASIDLDNPGPPCDCRDRYDLARAALKEQPRSR